jgi:hypothetical protein
MKTYAVTDQSKNKVGELIVASHYTSELRLSPRIDCCIFRHLGDLFVLINAPDSCNEFNVIRYKRCRRTFKTVVKDFHWQGAEYEIDEDSNSYDAVGGVYFHAAALSQLGYSVVDEDGNVALINCGGNWQMRSSTADHVLSANAFTAHPEDTLLGEKPLMRSTVAA